ncbi:DUF4328 domain-containing protein [Kribbella turkmenica]|uniref:DUF4328 domain-containing protein n=1 Tax=Kribbella turkmenica TaxID=2530375 RepID=A0A4R4WK43_9ACTN|nr:DUF4328 domain-containing protein [Kribbella turkmenica]TDD16884.1 DUF4328 domain-containing protein [Kribbella turkmenica]
MTQQYPMPYPVPYRPPQPVPPRYRPLKKIAIVSIALMGLTSVAAVVQAALMWSAYDEVKRFVYGLLSEEEVDRAVGSIAGSGPLLNLVGYLLMGTAIAFLIWLWQARENTEFLHSPLAPRPVVQDRPPHRHASGWIVGAWFCPFIQFWYPLQIVQDVTAASEPPDERGASERGPMRTLLYGWWATWTGFWVILVGGGGLAFLAFIVWIVRLIDAADTADATGDYVDIYDLQDFMVRVALAVTIGFTVATLFLIVAAVAASLLLLRVTQWQHGQATMPPAGAIAPPPEPPQYAPRYHSPGPTFPTYGPHQR